MNNSSGSSYAIGYFGAQIGISYLIAYLLSRPYEKSLHRKGKYTSQKVLWFRIIGTAVIFLLALSQLTRTQQH